MAVELKNAIDPPQFIAFSPAVNANCKNLFKNGS